MLKEWPKGSVACVVCRIDDPYRKEVPGSRLNVGNVVLSV